ncbi:MAG: non-canonical purine NTP pyrophosphatase [Oscillospiraceae bacterium]
MKDILGGMFDEIVSLKEAGIDHETVEDGKTFMENAVKKAREIAEISGCWAIADDSGICVDALGGAPWTDSARFSGHHGDDEANNRLLLEKLEGVEDRAPTTPVPSPWWGPGQRDEAEGDMYGSIGFEEKGSNGFGYDPLFVLAHDGGLTAAQISPEEKNRISYRSKALHRLLQELGKEK